ncbi:hypothetical protein RXV86_01565 [Alisedimentitalea sp. MJ-SS2]|uniref:hypothetical protein n=1 Tax=Aliisedimentitalea sp. MJ-SS2 TaxID=3049795 RepID=UPI00290F46A8|nr:hypothetical protein [Alisedimentitalea sp. MJ-SS2]MDU8926064.1 hypothetical protein [Alisedimentitalea sp. MJ-SS2]
MLKSPTVLALVAATILPTQGSTAGLKSPTVMPPANFQGQWWTNPVGCSYSRAGRPGEIVWFLSGKPPRGASCLEFFHQKKIDGGYRRAPFMVNG